MRCCIRLDILYKICSKMLISQLELGPVSFFVKTKVKTLNNPPLGVTGCSFRWSNYLQNHRKTIFKTGNGESGNRGMGMGMGMGNGNGERGTGNGERGTGNGESLKWGIFKSGNL